VVNDDLNDTATGLRPGLMRKLAVYSLIYKFPVDFSEKKEYYIFLST
jgi:hypothetical protein